MQTIASAKKQLNPDLKIDGVLITMTDARTNLSKHICNEVRDIYGSHVHVFKTEIPRCGLVTLNWTVLKRTVTIENQEKR